MRGPRAASESRGLAIDPKSAQSAVIRSTARWQKRQGHSVYVGAPSRVRRRNTQRRAHRLGAELAESKGPSGARSSCTPEQARNCMIQLGLLPCKLCYMMGAGSNTGLLSVVEQRGKALERPRAAPAAQLPGGKLQCAGARCGAPEHQEKSYIRACGGSARQEGGKGRVQQHRSAATTLEGQADPSRLTCLGLYAECGPQSSAGPPGSAHLAAAGSSAARDLTLQACIVPCMPATIPANMHKRALQLARCAQTFGQHAVHGDWGCIFGWQLAC